MVRGLELEHLTRPRRLVATRPSFLIAENAGGICSCVPTSAATVPAAKNGSSDIVRNRCGRDHATLGVVGVGFDAKDDARVIGLLGGGEVRSEARSRTHQHHQQAGGHGVERAGVAHAALAG